MQKAIKDLEVTLNDIKKEAKALEGKTLLISGGSGFLGTYINLIIYLLNENIFKKKCKVISIDNYITGTKKNLHFKNQDGIFKYLEQDIKLPIDIGGKIDFVIHAAGIASPFYYKKYPLETMESAIIGAKNLLELSRQQNIQSFLLFSSSEIYGNPDASSIPTPETYEGRVSSIGPRSCYDESKRLAETLSILYYQIYQVPVKIVRPFNIYGPGMKHTDYRVIPSYIYSGLKGKTLPVHDTGHQTRTFCYITDALTAIFKVLISGKNGHVYNIGNDTPELSMYELASIISELLGNGAKPRRKSYPAGYPSEEPRRRCPDLTKIKTELNYIPRIDLKSGLKKTIKWFKSEYNM